MSECEVFKLTPLKELLSRVKCRKCPYATDGHIYSDCKRSMKCHHCKEADHHPLLCSKKRQHKSKTNEWSFVMPSSQHQNGSAEVMIKYVKGLRVSYLRSLGETKLTYN